MTYYTDYHSHTGTEPKRFFKATLFQSQRVLLGLNCLESGQTQAIHTHENQDKFYFVLEGEGEFSVGATRRNCGTGFAVWAPAGVEHGVRNRGETPLVLLVGIAPAPPSNR